MIEFIKDNFFNIELAVVAILGLLLLHFGKTEEPKHKKTTTTTHKIGG